VSITGRFEADFESFYAAVEKAEAKLTDFQSGAGKVETSLNRMVDSFSGRRLIQEATLSAEAIERIGGVSKLTEDELQKVSAKATEAVAKMKAMGVAVPESLSAVAGEMKPVHEEMGFIGEQAADLGKAFIGAFAVEKVVEFALNVGKAEQALSRLSAETQIGTDELQDLTAATADYGLSNEELAKALFNVSKGIAGGDESVARGLSLIGVSLDQVKDKHGKDLFLEIEAGLSRLQGSLRDTAAADIFGSKLGAAMAGFSKEAAGAVAKAEEFNAKLSPAEIKDLKEYADQVERLEKNLGTLKDKILGGVAAAINSVTDAHRNGVSWVRLAWANAKDYLSVLGGFGPGVNLMTELAAAEGKAAEAQAALAEGAGEQVVELSKEAQAVQFLSTLRSNSAKELEPYQKRGLDDLRAMGQLNQQNAAAIGISSDQFKQYTENVRQAEVATKALTDATLANKAQLDKLAATATETFIKNHGTQTEIELADLKVREQADIDSLNRRAEALKASLASQHADTKENIDKIDAETAAATTKIRGYYKGMAEEVGTDWKDITAHTQASLDDAANRALKTLIDARSTIGTTREELDKLEAAYRKAATAATAMGQQSSNAGERGAASIDPWNKKVEELNKKYDELKKKQEELSFSTDITAANFDTYKAPQGLSKSSVLALLKQGFSLQNAVDILYAQARGVAIDLSKWPEEARGPRVPGFKYGVENYKGGTAVVGEDGPELVELPPGSRVIPRRGGRRAGGSGTSIYAPVYVSGVFDPSSAHALSRTVGGSIFQGVANARVLR
jgi:hypothetical protein